MLFETLDRRKDGSVFPVEVNAFDSELHGERVSLCIVRDISERKRAEAALQRRLQELEFLAEISGVVRTAETQDALLSAVLDRISAVFNARGAALAFPDPHSQDWVIEVGQGKWRSAPGVHIHPGRASGRQVAASRHYRMSNAAARPAAFAAGARQRGELPVLHRAGHGWAQRGPAVPGA